MKRIRWFMLMATSGFFIVLDQVLKFLTRSHPDVFIPLLPGIGWEYFANPGIAFSLPFPNILLIILTPFILWWLLVTVSSHGNSVYQQLGVSLILSGALSNLIDRIFFSATIDYLRIFTAVINLADIMIVLGFLLLIVHTKKQGPKNQPTV